MDFTIETYKKLLSSLQGQAYAFQAFEEFLRSPKEKSIVLRHDVDLLPGHSLRFARIQAELGIKGSYYFRAILESWDTTIIKEISALGHELGYHYETMDTARGDIDKAWDQFRFHLDELRKLTDVSTICMHGSPRSKFDNKDLWTKYDYKSLGIIGEPYFDIDFNKVLYLTDTGRRWDGWKVSVRDKVSQQEEWIKQGLVFHSTQDIISAIDSGRLLSAHTDPRRSARTESDRSGVGFGVSSGVEKPSKIMFTFHPQRWHSQPFPWLKELVMQNTKNQVKRFLIKR